MASILLKEAKAEVSSLVDDHKVIIVCAYEGFLLFVATIFHSDGFL